MFRLVCLATLGTAAALAGPFASGFRPEAGQAATVRDKADRAIRARAVLRKYCHECHGGQESRGTIAVMDHARLVAGGPNPVPFVAPGDAAKSQIIQFIEDGSMPPGGRPRPSADEVATLKAWISDSAPGFPASFDPDATLKLLLDDAAGRPGDAPHVRYLSFAHLLRDDAPPPDLAGAERDLFAALRDCGLTEMPTPVDPTATLYRLDTRQAGWNSRELFVRESQGAEGAYPLTPYDLLLLEYPHAATLAVVHPLARRLDDYLAAAKLARPVPVLRGDWLTAALGKDSPLAADLRSLTELEAALARGGTEPKLPCGPRPRAFGRRNPVPAAAGADADGAILPLGSWYAGDCQPARPPFSLTAELVNADGKPVKSVKTGEEFRLRVTPDHAVHFALVMVWADGRAVFQPTTHNGFLPALENLLRPAEAARDGFAIADILTGEKQAVEYFVLLASPDPMPKPLIVRSRHASGANCEKMTRFPVYRFLPEPDAKFDPSRVVRKVIPVPVTAPKDD